MLRGVVASVMHTGTWFTMAAVARLTGQVVVPWARTIGLRAANPEAGQPFDWLQLHLMGQLSAVPWDEYRFFRRTLQETLVDSGHYPVVVPFRDPLLTLITHENRRERRVKNGMPPDQRFTYVVDALEELVRLAQLDHVHVFRVDAEGDDRHLVARDLARFVGIDPNSRNARVLAAAWTPANVTQNPETDLKSRYLLGDMAAVGVALPEELARLQRSEALVEFCRAQGYLLPWMAVAV